MSNDAENQYLRQQLDQYRQRDQQQAIDSTIGKALEATVGGRVRPETSAALVATIRGQLQTATLPDGRTVVVGPDGKDAQLHVASLVASEAYSGFLLAAQSEAQQQQPADPRSRSAMGQMVQGLRAAGIAPPSGPLAPGEPTLGDRLVAHEQSVRQQQGDPRANMGLPFGLSRKPQ
jgi:hypothetical protein